MFSLLGHLESVQGSDARGARILSRITLLASSKHFWKIVFYFKSARVNEKLVISRKVIK